MKVFYTKRAVKDLSALPTEFQKRIADKMRFFISEKETLEICGKVKRPKLGRLPFPNRSLQSRF